MKPTHSFLAPKGSDAKSKDPVVRFESYLCLWFFPLPSHLSAAQGHKDMAVVYCLEEGFPYRPNSPRAMCSLIEPTWACLDEKLYIGQPSCTICERRERSAPITRCLNTWTKG